MYSCTENIRHMTAISIDVFWESIAKIGLHSVDLDDLLKGRFLQVILLKGLVLADAWIEAPPQKNRK